MSRSKSNKWRLALGTLLSFAFLAFLFGGGVEKTVTRDFLQRYEISKRNGDAMETCVQAGIVVAAYLQEHDAANHKKWIQIEDADCRKAGMPTFHTP